MTDINTVDDYAGKLSGLASRAVALGEIMEESKMAFKERIKEETQDEDQSKLMFVKNDAQGRGGQNNSRGRGRGYGGRGRGRGRGRSNGSDGHNKGGEASDKTRRTTLSIWYLDNGANNHMTGKREFFSNLDESIKGKVVFGDGSNVEVVGKGSITFNGKTGERRSLKDIYYIPSLKHNIISLGQATKNGCEVKMKGDLLILSDPCGRLLVQFSRSPNRLYKTPMEIEYPECLQIQ
ncbi:uncharacterized protein LOC130509919 [Raphanus sativus]|uniref:Uncharacterized protein LOC130509919 n=1 Tax=Raphanus sativus TaxID=3726 RepID=A0A9W3DEA1_RAPSA|nr:uncharacterized protein LOC130509919 [Raphanus sativus]